MLSSVRGWYALAYHAPLRTRFGMTHERNLSIFGVQFAWATAAGRYATVSYTVDVLPMVVATQNPDYRDVTGVIDSSGFVIPVVLEYRLRGYTAYGAGIVPLGFAVTFGHPRTARVTLGASGGGVLFNRRLPDPRERLFNFIADVTARVEIPIRGSTGVTIGYRLNHISNGNLGPYNPSMNSSMLEIGGVLERWR